MLKWPTPAGILVIGFGAYAVWQMAIDPITWDSAVAIGLFLLVAAPTSVAYIIRKCRARTLFEMYYEPSPGAKAETDVKEVHPDTQRTHFTLRMSLNTYVEFLAIFFEGTGTLPTIQDLDDWQWERGHRPSYVEMYPLPDGRWYWRYHSPHRRQRTSRITIGISYIATGFFKGDLVIQMTTLDGTKARRLPFEVRHRSKTGN